MIAALGIVSCSSAEPTAPLVACTEPITARVEGAGDEARFTWTPRCGLSFINVIAPPTVGVHQDMWRLASDQQLIGPGIRYGERPPGTRTEVPATPVTAGKTYFVGLTGERNKPPVAIVYWPP